MLSTHYRKPINFSDEALKVSESSYKSIFRNYAKRYNQLMLKIQMKKYKNILVNLKEEFKKAIEDI